MGKTKGTTTKNIDCTKVTELVKTSGFTDEYHDIFDPVLHGNKRTTQIRFTLQYQWETRTKKSANSTRGSNWKVYNPKIEVKTNKIALWDVGLGHMMLPQVFPCPEIVMLCTENYDQSRRIIINKNTQKEIVSITEKGFKSLLDIGLGAEN